MFVATSENPWERGRLARIFLKNAGMMPALPAKNKVFRACLVIQVKSFHTQNNMI